MALETAPSEVTDTSSSNSSAIWASELASSTTFNSLLCVTLIESSAISELSSTSIAETEPIIINNRKSTEINVITFAFSLIFSPPFKSIKKTVIIFHEKND